MLKVQSFELGSSSFTCQKPKLASSAEKVVALGIREAISSMVYIGYCSLFMTLLRSRGSIQILSFPFVLTTVTMELTHSVGSYTRSITSSFSKRCSSFLFYLGTEPCVVGVRLVRVWGLTGCGE